MVRVMIRKVLLAATCACAIASPSLAAQFQLTYTSAAAPILASLLVTTANALNTVGGYDVTGISGNVDGDTVTGLIANPNQPNPTGSSDGLFIYDNVQFPGPQVLSSWGLYFASATHQYNLFSDSATQYELYQATGGGYTENSAGTLDVQAVPEPSAWMLMTVGFGALGVMLRRRRARSALA